ncbi:perilipin-2-like isoform X3 [Acanthopagrus latus]|uniref:perilipin-2-like isoform X3 n=1 Tax=Acanthopagrus latus TaxID=8177 RepID=UPI00187C188F|nr:perilipin-2-like isoform X3 [Acanthopagrus latus]
MPMNNNQKGQSVAARLAKLPVVRSACIRLSVLYTDTKCSHPSLMSVCEGLETRVTALASPVIVKLEPHISIANDVACKSLDWLETRFPVLHTPTEEIVATAKTKMHEIQDVVSTAANGTVDCVTWLMDMMQQGGDRADQPLVDRAISVACMGLDAALIRSEALMDRVLPPTEEDKGIEAHLLEGFDVATPRRSYPVQLVSLTAKLCRRTYHMVGSRIQSVQMYNLSCPLSQQHRPNQKRRCPSAAEPSTHKDVVQVHHQATPPAVRMRWPTKTSPFDNGCDVKGCIGR